MFVTRTGGCTGRLMPNVNDSDVAAALLASSPASLSRAWPETCENCPHTNTVSPCTRTLSTAPSGAGSQLVSAPLLRWYEASPARAAPSVWSNAPATNHAALPTAIEVTDEIGRASCRERV